MMKTIIYITSWVPKGIKDEKSLTFLYLGGGIHPVVFRCQEGKELVSGSWRRRKMSRTAKKPKIHTNPQTWNGGGLCSNCDVCDIHIGCFSVQFFGYQQIKYISQLPKN